MPKRSEQPPPRSRYRYEDVTLEIEHLLRRKGRGSQKQAAAAAKLTPPQFSKRMRSTGDVGERFRIEHLGAIADWADAPKGWPFIPWDVAEGMEKAVRARRRR